MPHHNIFIGGQLRVSEGPARIGGLVHRVSDPATTRRVSQAKSRPDGLIGRDRELAW